MANFLQMREHLRQYTMGGLGKILEPGDAYSDLLNRSLDDLWSRYEWSYRLTNCVVDTWPPKQNGLITVTSGSPLVIGAGTQFSLIDVGSFLWVGGIGSTPLPVASVAGAQSLTLSAPYAGASQTTSYVLAPRYYLVPGAQEVISVVSQTVLLQKRLLEELNALDPTRTTVGGTPSDLWCQAPPSPNGDLMIELWPIPGDARGYLVQYYRSAPVMVNDRDIPFIPSVVVEEAAMITACEMMFASTSQRSWLELRDKHQSNLDGGLTPPGGVLGEALSRDAARQMYTGRLQKPESLIATGYDSATTPLNPIFDP